jgi:hypothetical protein
VISIAILNTPAITAGSDAILDALSV